MIDLHNVSILIPYKYDTQERLTNLKTVLGYLSSTIVTTIIVGEFTSNGEINPVTTSIINNTIRQNNQYIHYFSLYNPISVIHKTKMLNELFKRSSTPVVCNYDCDVIVDCCNILKSVTMIQNSEFDIMTPFDGTCYDIEPTTETIRFVRNNTIDMINLNGVRKRRSNTIGGINIIDSKKYIECGLQNEKFIGWGAEDDEFIYRAKSVGLRFGSIPGILYHLIHPIPNNSRFKNPYYKENMVEYNRIQNMTKEQLHEYTKGMRK